ncbi:metallophosphoesterase [bacterium]|nr:metallophosphoesterase [bacterium]
MSWLNEKVELPEGVYRDIIKQGNFSDLVQALADMLKQESEQLRPHDSQARPGAIEIVPDRIARVLYFGDIHPSRKNLPNFERALDPFWDELKQGTLAIVLAGDFTHPGEDDLTDMQPSVQMLGEYLIPLKLSFPDQIVLIRGDHESVGSPFAEDFGKGTDFLPSWTIANGLDELLESGLLWALGPNKPEFGPKQGRFAGIYLNTPEAERYVISGKKFGREAFAGSWHPFHRIEEKDGKQYLVFRGSDKNPAARWIRIERESDLVRFYLENDGEDTLCSIALNQSRTYGHYLEKIAGKSIVQLLQQEVYDQLPLIVSGKCFAGIHGAPPDLNESIGSDPSFPNLTRQDLVELSNPDYRQDNKNIYRRLIFGRPIEGNSFSMTPQTIEYFLELLGNNTHDLFLMAHTRPDHFLESYRRLFPQQGKELMLNKDIYAPFGIAWNHFVIDSQSSLCSHLLIENRRPLPECNETVHELFTIRTVQAVENTQA